MIIDSGIATSSFFVSGTLTVTDGITGSLFGTSSYALTASYTTTASYVLQAVSASFATLAQTANTASYVLQAVSSSYASSSTSASYALSASQAANSTLLNSTSSTVFATTGSNIFRGNQTVTGSLFTSGSNTLIGSTTLTGSLLISGSTTQIGSNTLQGNTTLSGSIIISGSSGPGNITSSVQVYGNIETNGYIRFDPVSTNIDNSVSASYIYVSGSTNDLHFSQNGSGYTNTTRLRWLEGNLYTGVLSGGVLSSTPGSTTFNLSSGSAIIVSLNASTGSTDPFPTIQYVKWGNYLNQPILYSGSAKITYISLTNAGAINQQTVPIGSTDVTQWDTQVEIGIVLHLSGSVSTGVYNAPQLAYGFAQRTDDFLRAFGPLKISGHTLQASGSSPTLSIKKSSGTAYNNGSNYVNNPNHPSLTSDPDINISKIYRYYISGSTPIIDTGIANAGYTAIDSKQYVDTTTGTLTAVGAGFFSIQRVFWIPNSPTNAFIVYYGNARYGNLVDAKNGIDTETFLEAPNTAQNGILLGYIIIQGGGAGTPARDLLNASEAAIIQAGLFRNVGGIGSSGTAPIASTLAGLADVSIASRTSGDLLVYNGALWVNNKTLNGNYSITGSLTSTSIISASAFSGSFFGTSSWAQNAVTASYILNAISSSYASSSTSASFASTAALAPLYVLTSATSSMLSPYVLNSQTSSMSVLSASYASGSTSASFASTTSFAPLYVLNSITASMLSPYVLTSQTSSMTVLSASYASGSTSASFSLTASSADNFLVRNTLTAQTLVVQTITSSTDYVTGSTRFGSLSSNTHVFTGSMSISGSITVSGSIINNLTASNASNAITSSYASASTSASYASASTSASFATQAANATTASYILLAVSASYASASTSASYASGSTSASFASTASYILGGGGSGTPGGSNTQIQYNNSNTFGGVPTLTYDGTTLRATGSFTGSFTGSLFGTASYITSSNVYGPYNANSILSASYASGSTSASFATSSSIASTSSYGNATSTVGYTIGGSQIYYASILSSTSPSSANVFTNNTGSFVSAFYNYTLYSGSNARSGQISAVWSGNAISYNDYSTTDIGNTSTVTASIVIVTGQVQLNFQVPSSVAGWNIKATATYI